MAEFGMRHTPSFNAGQQPMEWYSTAASSQYNAANYAYAAPPQAAPSSFNPNSFEEEPPLLEELGIDVGLILRRTKAILLHQMRSSSLDELDMGGALMFALILSGLHLLMGKMHFGYVLGWSVVQSILLYFVVNQIASSEASEARSLDLYSCCCITGYGMVPLVLLSIARLLLPRGPTCAGLAVLFAAWSALTAAKVLSRVSPALSDVRGLVAVPCFLMYSSFALLTVY